MPQNSMKDRRPGVGVAVIVTSSSHPNCVVLGKRKGGIGSGLYQLPGGHLEFGETWEKAAAREVLEETGLHINNVELCQVQNTILEEENYHYVTIVMIGEVVNADSCEPMNIEPEKCEGWSWVHWNDLPSVDKLFWAFRDFYKSGKNPFIK
ncbi:nucleotide triphosphate diphosphatase NUDT15 [Parasteatoda tepidariorum]|uniref:nucleotide triphosphate diphosphatase NUDT15 n=1 Tax=Parasteatoda tepidariorum TaxID=114398 RepID=UPI00077FCE95|nr:nucleotide triphosphate diphosphatase NUDT15 [Parasteatoda tepidariorum]